MKATRVCSVEGCDRVAIAIGMCNTHRIRMDRRGTTDPRHVPSVAERLTAGLVRMPNGCLEWTRGLGWFGYGKISVKGQATGTHRVAWEIANGPIPDDLDVLHHCDNPPCCQTDPTEGYPEGHLFLGTDVDNAADRSAKGRSRGWDITHCPRGHEYAGENLYESATGGRRCRACARARNADVYYNRRREASAQ